MSSMRVRLEDFADQRLPPVCVVTGEPAQKWGFARAERGPSGLWFFAIGWWVFFLPRQHVDGWLPYSTAAMERLKRNRRRAWTTAASAVVAGVVVFALELYWLVLACACVAVVAAFFGVNAPGSVGANLLRDARWVGLAPVHPAFVAAYEEQLAIEG